MPKTTMHVMDKDGKVVEIIQDNKIVFQDEEYAKIKQAASNTTL